MTLRRDGWNLVGLVGAWLCAVPAWAQVCTSDEQCEAGQHCDRPPGVRESCDGGACGDAGAVQGRCAAKEPDDIDCQTDADCGAGFECERGASSPGCDPSDGGRCPDAGITYAETGRCEPKPIPCDSDDECPEALKCGGGGGTGSCTREADGGTVCGPVEPADKECRYVPEDCDSDGDCDARYTCLVVSTVEECSGGGPVCIDGENCPAPEPTECTTRDVKTCFPERIDCKTDDDCDGGWRCVEIPEDARGDDAPEGWEDAVAVCFPEGLALVAEGRVESLDFDGGEDSANGGGAPTRGEDAGKGTGDGGCRSCHVGRAQALAPPSLVFAALAALGALALRRRARR